MKSYLTLIVLASAIALHSADAPITGDSLLTNILSALHRSGEKDSDIERPGWRDPSVIQGLSRIAGTSTNADDVRTARTWLAAIEFENIQAETRRAEIRRKVDAFTPKLDVIIGTDRKSWQGKVARMLKSGALLFARRFDECRAEVAGILQEIEDFKSEQHPQFTQFLKFQKQSASDLDAEARFLLVVASALEKDWSGAVSQAEELQRRCPDWSKRRKIDNALGFLRRETSPFHIP